MVEVTITITKKKRPKGRGSSKKRPSGVVKPRKNRDDLGRRRASSGLIEFYDMGLEWNGSAWVDRNLSIVPNELSPGDFGIATDKLADSNWQPTRDQLLGVPNRPVGFKKIAHADMDMYGLTIAFNGEAGEVVETANPNWTPSGFKNASTINRIAIEHFGPLGYMFDTGDMVNYKVTAIGTYGSPAVPLSASKNSKIYFSPVLAMHAVSSSQGVLFDTIVGGGYYDLMPRATFPVVFAGGSGSLPFNTWLAYIAAHPANRTWTQTSGSTSTSGGTVETVPPADNGNVEFYATNVAPGSAFVGNDAYPPEGMLAAIVESGANTFFVWIVNPVLHLDPQRHFGAA